jgi:hypothetical protein
MKLFIKKYFLAFFILPLTLSLLITANTAEARGGFGFGGGSFRGGETTDFGARGGEVETGRFGGAEATGPNGGEAVRTPYGGGAAVGPNGGEAVRTPYGGTAVTGPAGDAVVVNPNEEAAVVREGERRAVEGSLVYTVPTDAVATVIDGTTYYVDGDTYYEQVYEGSQVVYIVVAAPDD